MEVVKKEYVYTIKLKNGRLKEIRRPIQIYGSHRSCILNFDKELKIELKKEMK